MKRIASVLAVLPLLVSCGGGDDPEDDFVDAINSMPKCADIWEPGKTLPKDYDGCERDDGDIEAAVSSGECEVVSYDDRMYAARGGVIGEAVDTGDPDYQKALTDC